MGCGCVHATAKVASPEYVVQTAAEPATLLNSTSRDQQEFALRAEALRVFDLAVKDQDGRMDMKLFSRVANTYVTACANDALLDLNDADIYLKDCVSRQEWLAYFCKLSEADETVANLALKKYEKHLVEHQNVQRNFAFHRESVPSDWRWYDEVVRVFALADKDQNGQLDIAELTNVRNSHEGAEAMMLKADMDLSGTLSQDEWVTYFYLLFL